MESVTISPKFQVVIPKAVRESFGLSAGQKVQVIAYGTRIELIPEQPIEQMRGFLRGMNTTIDPEEDRL